MRWLNFGQESGWGSHIHILATEGSEEGDPLCLASAAFTVRGGSAAQTEGR